MTRRDVKILAVVALATVPCWVASISYDAGQVSADSYRSGKVWSEIHRAGAEQCDERVWDLPAPEVNRGKWFEGCLAQVAVRESRH